MLTTHNSALAGTMRSSEELFGLSPNNWFSRVRGIEEVALEVGPPVVHAVATGERHWSAVVAGATGDGYLGAPHTDELPQAAATATQVRWETEKGIETKCVDRRSGPQVVAFEGDDVTVSTAGARLVITAGSRDRVVDASGT